MGWSGWKSNSSKPINNVRGWEDKTIAPRVAVLRQKVAAIESRPAKTVDEYVANTLEIEPDGR